MNINQSIETHYVGPTNYRGSRIIAKTPGARRITQNWNYEINEDANHYAAAEALRAKLGWPSIKAGGSTAKGYAFVTSILGA